MEEMGLEMITPRYAPFPTNPKFPPTVDGGSARSIHWQQRLFEGFAPSIAVTHWCQRKLQLVQGNKVRGHVNKIKLIQKDFGSGWVGQVSNWKFKKIGKHIFIHYFITFLGEHSNVNNVINALLGLCSCFYVQVFVVNYF